jgi:hypothetical protein
MKTIYHSQFLKQEYPLLITFVGKEQFVVYLDENGYYYIDFDYNKQYISFSDVSIFIGKLDKNKNPIYTGHEIKYETLHEIWNKEKGYCDKYEHDTGYIILNDNGFVLIKKENLINPKHSYLDLIEQYDDGNNEWYNIENLEDFNFEIISHINQE